MAGCVAARTEAAREEVGAAPTKSPDDVFAAGAAGSIVASARAVDSAVDVDVAGGAPREAEPGGDGSTPDDDEPVVDDALGEALVVDDALGEALVVVDALGEALVVDDALGEALVVDDALGEALVVVDALGEALAGNDALGEAALGEALVDIGAPGDEASSPVANGERESDDALTRDASAGAAGGLIATGGCSVVARTRPASGGPDGIGGGTVVPLRCDVRAASFGAALRAASVDAPRAASVDAPRAATVD
jgi:hypothetical protein